MEKDVEAESRVVDEDRDRVIESELKGLTLRIYWHILGSKKRSVGVRPVQRALRLSSPSVALHHLEKLRTLGLLEKDQGGEYHLIEQVKVGVTAAVNNDYRVEKS